MIETAPTGTSGLVRAIGRWSLVALTVNSIIGSGIFGLPSVVANLIGKISPLAVLFAGAGMAVIMGCYAEVASYFHEAGGPYLYARAAFGRMVGIQTAWMLPRFVILTVLVGVLAIINFRGVRGGAQVSNIFTAAKLIPLFAVIVMGGTVMWAHHPVATAAPVHASAGEWLKAMLLLAFAYGGFETAVAPMSEARNPRRDVPFALFSAVLACTVIYALIQYVVVGTLPNAAHSDRPLADVARLALGHFGAGLVAIGALISVYGYLSAKILSMPRVTFALAEQGDFPHAFAAVHPRFKTPYVSLLVFAALIWGFALMGEFKWNVTLSAIARLFYYAVGCAALPVLRRKRPEGALFRLPGGTVFAVLGIAICLVLISQVDFGQSLILIATIAIALVNWAVVARGKVAT
jgi:APA family basic amino acid/polyamine antiporter